MPEELNKEFKRFSEKLDIAIGLLYELNDSLTKKSSIKDKVSYLSNRGLGNKEIARALGISESHVSKEKSLSNKEKQGDEDGREEIVLGT